VHARSTPIPEELAPPPGLDGVSSGVVVTVRPRGAALPGVDVLYVSGGRGRRSHTGHPRRVMLLL